MYLEDYSIVPCLTAKAFLGNMEKAPYLVTRRVLIGCLRFSGLTWYDIAVLQCSRVSRKEVKSWMCYETNDSDLFVAFRFASVALNHIRCPCYVVQ